MRVLRNDISKGRRTAAIVFALGLCLALFTPFAPRAQRRQEAGANVTGVATRATDRGAVVSITGDAPLTRAQTWQDEEGFHIVGYKWEMKSGTPRGVKVRRVGDSLEMIVPVRRGGSVAVHPRFNSLEIVVNGGLATDDDATAKNPQPQRQAERAGAAANPRASNERADRRHGNQARDAANALSRNDESPRGKQTEAQTRAARQSENSQAHAPAQSDAEVPASDAARQQTEQPIAAPPVEQLRSSFAQNVAPAAEAPAAPATPDESPTENPATPASGAAGEGGGSSLLLAAVLVVLLFAMLFGFFYLRSRWQGAGEEAPGETSRALVARAAEQALAQVAAKTSAALAAGAGETPAVAKVSPDAGPQPLAARREGAFASAAPPPVLFGALRIEQEVEKLVRGEAHSVEVLASRAADDRRAVEAALLKAVNSRKHAEGERARARRALEEYGFVARSAAALLSSPDVFDRSSAARALGSIRSAAAMPFLLEALYDGEPVVRAEAVASLGALGMPSAIGALLDLARRHPDIPPQLLGSALSACSVDCISLGADGDSFSLAGDDWFTGEIAGLEPVADIEQLPDWLEDETLAEALERLSSADVEARVAAAQQLSHFSVARSVAALALMAADDRDASVRAAAVTSLGHIGHETVFAPVLIAMADEAREVRAAAARSLSRLGFDRADAYVRVLETSDEETLRRLTDACVSAGLARQALDRLASDDRRQAYEAFTLLSLVARGGGAGMILEAVESHTDLNARIAAARLLALQGEPVAAERLRRLAADARTPERLRAAISEVVTRAEQRPAEPAGALGD